MNMKIIHFIGELKWGINSQMQNTDCDDETWDHIDTPLNEDITTTIRNDIFNNIKINIRTNPLNKSHEASEV